jgi:leucyl aminopeptidase
MGPWLTPLSLHAQITAAKRQLIEMNYFTTTGTARRLASSCIIVGIYDGSKLGVAAADINAASKGRLSALVKQGDISTRLGECTILPALDGVKAKRVLVTGLGKASEFGVRQYREAIAAALGAVRYSKIGDVTNFLALENVDGTSPYYLARYAVETIGDSLYRFDVMKSGRKTPGMPLKKIGMALKKRSDARQVGLGHEHADAIVAGMSIAKDLGNLPPNVCTPSYLARTAVSLSKKHRDLTTKVLNEAEIKRLGMHSFLSVTSGTSEPAKLIVMQYKGTTKQKPIVLVGKGITFDAGGISLKPGPGMDEMKYDMCGAASVMATMATVAMLKLPINLNVVIPTCENLPSSTATRPGDIITSMSGQTIEILNTDAEGRLILCDALTYSRRFKPETIIDVATLTGACVIALGHHRTAIMSNDDTLADELRDGGIAADDRGWPMPMGHEYDKELKSNFADFANIGLREGGAITAACFLAKFTQGMRWAHLDIAGTAWRSGGQKGGTGRPVPMLTEFLLRRARALP